MGRDLKWDKPVSTAPVPPKEPPSEEFERAFGGSGSCRVKCGFCGREEYNSDGGWDWDDGELEALRADPNAEDVYYTPTWGYLVGKQYLHGCPCNEARRYEDFIWSHRHGIIRYLRARTQANLKTAEADAAEVKPLETDYEDHD